MAPAFKWYKIICYSPFFTFKIKVAAGQETEFSQNPFDLFLLLIFLRAKQINLKISSCLFLRLLLLFMTWCCFCFLSFSSRRLLKYKLYPTTEKNIHFHCYSLNKFISNSHFLLFPLYFPYFIFLIVTWVLLFLLPSYRPHWSEFRPPGGKSSSFYPPVFEHTDTENISVRLRSSTVFFSTSLLKFSVFTPATADARARTHTHTDLQPSTLALPVSQPWSIFVFYPSNPEKKFSSFSLKQDERKSLPPPVGGDTAEGEKCSSKHKSVVWRFHFWDTNTQKKRLH